jgi:N12 class adenine-specific DNA methylase
MDLLNKEYEKFIKLFSPLHDPKNKKKLVFADDPDYPLVLSLEQWDDINKKAAKADIFTKRVIQPFKKITHVD